MADRRRRSLSLDIVEIHPSHWLNGKKTQIWAYTYIEILLIFAI